MLAMSARRCTTGCSPSRPWRALPAADRRYRCRAQPRGARRGDPARSDLAGAAPDGEERQSARFDLYEAEFAKLALPGRVYRCYETAQELDLKRKVLLGRGLPPIYDRAALSLSEADHAAKAAAGESPHWRFLLDRAAPIAWDRWHSR
jgi:hypothetical protein